MFVPAPAIDLDRIVFAVDGAESRHGRDPGVWRPDPAGPQGPMRVSLAAALNVGGGDCLDLARNRALGRAYLAHLYRRYGDRADMVMVYDRGPARLDQRIAEGRPAGCRSRSSAIATGCWRGRARGGRRDQPVMAGRGTETYKIRIG